MGNMLTPARLPRVRRQPPTFTNGKKWHAGNRSRVLAVADYVR
jgi:hypothetical protein